MSDPVSKTEIEDVLSSIRRLVSEESWTEPRRAAPPEKVEHGRLVLTPSLRVADTPRSKPDPQSPTAGKAPLRVAESGDARESADAAANTDGPAGPLAFLLEPETQAGDLAADPPSDRAGGDDDMSGPEADPTGEGAPWSDPSATLFASARSAVATPREEPHDAQAGPGPDPDAADAGDAEGGIGEAAQRDDPEPEAEAAQDGERAGTAPREEIADDPAEDDGDTQAGKPSARDRHDEPEPETEAEPEIGQDVPEDAPDGRQAPGEPSGAFRAGTLNAKIQALEAAIGRTRDQWEPDGTGMDDYAGTPVETIQWEDHDHEGPDAPADEADGAARPEPGTGAADVLSSDETFLDEDSLRELVADIVREELQGALGERITRNVRKLVRREIHRALTAQELD
ncbi:MAG: hypothetical protein KDK02_16785 [Rhodobacteraceae bacterium]|nr:hypothetical protein [Paracoccaceae bacterium]